MMTVYHGGTEIVQYPRVDAGRLGLDFGMGFYVTKLQAQVEHALSELSRHQPNHQICILNQKLIDKCLIFSKAIDYVEQS